ncbi:putative 2-aminoethylphosphonate ABC transporter ATP-binding protein [Pararhodobacter oceanensis]|uniref:Putative 2-aminoethylphosphonate ABC transporter ATP-binding protein n=1 Tax=Pararhodobacter oceanensis TaxID=2172121 RepID=A0A2T8HTX5_9RHOB|nr:putative 2-aminoethylphosphonate ABC transporter ATP-binding protein [Pararhodobacter oceanensis]PVH28894.1 putative 2-aminoethylphosphonate ABC transporter ATP-binding protein [Pararhodobacter oceanensis]
MVDNSVNPSRPVEVTEAEKALRISGLSKSFGAFQALRDIELEIEKGEFVCFLGPSGCGKTTLLRAIAGLEPQDYGLIEQNGEDVSSLPVHRRDFGIVFQSYALFPNLSVTRNVGYGLRGTGMSKAQRHARIDDLLAMVGLEGQGSKYPAQLSGGQQQRVALARALAPSPGLLLLDEPLSALDAQVRLHLRDQLRQLQRDLGVTTIMVTHDQDEALAIADRIVVMRQGEIEQIGSPEEVFTAPATPFVAGFLGDMNFIPANVHEGGTLRIGTLPVAGAHAHGFGSGAAVNLCIRPANILVGTAAEGAPNQLQTRIETISFRGNVHRLVVRCDAIDQSLELEFRHKGQSGFELTEGAPLTVALPPEDLVVFRAEG